MTRHTFVRTGLALVLLASGACYSTRVTRIEPSAVTDLSGRWNDTDSRLVANQLVEQTLAAGWAKRYTDMHGGEAPTVIVSSFTNRTLEHIQVGTFVKDIFRPVAAIRSASIPPSGRSSPSCAPRMAVTFTACNSAKSSSRRGSGPR